MPWDRLDGYYGVQHSLTSHPPKGGVTQRDRGKSDKFVFDSSSLSRPTLTKPQDPTENNGICSWLGLDFRFPLGYAVGVVTGILLAAVLDRFR